METLAPASEVLPNFLVYDTISATPTSRHDYRHIGGTASASASFLAFSGGAGRASEAAACGVRKPARKRRRKQRNCKNEEEAESQRMTHIAVERNRRRLMNEHLAVLRSLMPESYIQRGDQASIVGGAIDFVKELEQLLQSLEVQKRKQQQQQQQRQEEQQQQQRQEEHQQQQQQEEEERKIDEGSNGSWCGTSETNGGGENPPPFAQFFAYPQYMWRHAPKEYSPAESHRAPASLADIEVALVETHASLRILSPKRPGQLLKMVAGFQALQLTVLHLNVTTLDTMVLYTFSAKVEEGCSLASVDDIAAAVHHMLSLIEAEANLIS